MTLTLDDCVASLAADVRAADLDEKLILMLHSSGGLVAPGLLRALGGRIAHLVYSSASVPPEGGCGLDCMRERHAEGVRRLFESARAEGRTITTLDGPAPDREKARLQYGGEPLDDELVDYVIDPVRRVPDSYSVYFQTVSWQGTAPDLPVTYLENLRDRAVPRALQEQMIERLPFATRVIALDGGHVPSVTQPAVVAALLDGIAAGL
jgi:pimeloyl-ACP methyl ester carboxylesterase